MARSNRLAEALHDRLLGFSTLVGMAGVVLLAASTALAVDGVYEINQTCAVQTGCVPGDGPGFPVRISGIAIEKVVRVRLTSSLVIPSTRTTNVIELVGDDISIDLNGFAIARDDCLGDSTTSGVTYCPLVSGPQIGIAGTAWFPGIATLSSNVRVENGMIIGMTQGGIDLGRAVILDDVHIARSASFGARLQGNSQVRNSRFDWNGGCGLAVGLASTIESVSLRRNNGSGICEQLAGFSFGVRVSNANVAENGGDGIRLGGATHIRDSLIRANGGDGVFVGTNSHLAGNLSAGNGSSGFEAGNGSTLVDNTARSNGATGLFLGNGVAVRGTTSNDNTGDGIFTGSGSSVSDNTTYGNGGDGIEAGTDSLVMRNTARLNAGYGLNLSDGTGYRENVVNDNTTGTVDGGINLFDNVCNANTTCP